MTKMKAFILVIVTVFLLGAGSGTTAAAATTPAEQLALNYNVYLKLDGITGDSKADRFANWIELTGVEFEVAGSTAPAQGTGAGAGKARLDHFTVSKKYDSSSVSLTMNAISGKHIKSGQIVFVKPNTERPVTVLKIDLSDVVITDYQFNNMYESVAFGVGAIDFSYAADDDKGGNKAPVQGGWDFKANKATK